MMTQANQQQSNNGFKQRLDRALERLRSGELRARLHYFLFRQSQQAQQSDSLLFKYKARLKEDWPKWLGIGMTVTALIMFFSPERFWLWQIPLAGLIVLLAPLFFELPATLNSVFGYNEHQHLVGQIITLTNPIVDGQSQIKIDDKTWVIAGPPCEAGQEVKIITLDANCLYVTPFTTDMRALK